MGHTGKSYALELETLERRIAEMGGIASAERGPKRTAREGPKSAS
jgi:hypothetical protein